MDDFAKARKPYEAIGPDPVPWRGQERVTVYVPHDVAYNFEKMTALTKNLLGKLGCDGCHSGRVIDYHVVRDFVVNPKTLQVDEYLPGQIQQQIRG